MALSLAVVLLAQQQVDSFWHEQLHSSTHRQVPGLDDFVVLELARMALMLLFANIIGLLHHWSHGRDMWRGLKLEARQRAVMRCIEEETASCDRLLKSILPPQLVGTLGSLERIAQAQRDPCAGEASPRGGVSPPNGTPASLRFSSDGPPVRPRGSLLAESFHDCAFLFAKARGISRAHPRREASLIPPGSLS